MGLDIFLLQFSDIPGFAGLKEEDYERTLTCVFWDTTLDSGYGNWSSIGCRLNSDTVDKAFCECDHLTSFALLMVCTYVRLNSAYCYDTMITFFFRT